MSSITGILTGGLIDPSTPDYAGLASKNERSRQSIIDLGMKQLGAIFGGGEAPFYSLANAGGAKFDPSAQYYFLSGKDPASGKGGFQPYAMPRPRGKGPLGFGTTGSNGALLASGIPMGAGLGGTIGNLSEGNTQGAVMSGMTGGLSDLFGLFGGGKSPLQIEREKFKSGKLYNQSTKTFQGFDDSFFNQRANDYVAYAMPQLADQYQSTKKALGYGIANKGLQGGSAERDAMSQLDRQTGQAKQQIEDTGQNQAQTLRTNVQNSENQAIQYLYQTADPAGASAQAIGSAANFKVPQTFTPIANMFSNLISQYYTNQILNSSSAPNYVLPPQYSTGTSALGGVYSNS